ncbi:HCL221Cp [Eremothecium sinecaudum]|uniref:HCL221Cp n=1 Tax=Eremothecium sinecaudum TaxID=45286 RepID=A0A0X8HR60_9SACH|nr:HCL221Cp [Eremothecium sinecaudum]AMD19930.1 HCL221Cp [Eremothecium sinecaudum]
MGIDFNTRNLTQVLRGNLFEQLNACTSSEPIVLLIQPSLLPLVNCVSSFSHLIQKTRVNLIVTLDEESTIHLRGVDLSLSKLVALIDVRTDLIVPESLGGTLQELELTVIDLVYATWNNLRENSEAVIFPNHIQLQLPDVSINLHPWYMLPICHLDDNLLNCNTLYTSDNQNLYYPKTASLAETTRTVLVSHMVQSLASICEESDITITHSISLGPHSKKVVEQLRDQLLSTETYDAQFQREMLYGKKHSGLQTNLIVIERSIDPVTPLLSQLTYSGTLNDIFGFSLDTKLKELKNNDILEESAKNTEISLDYTLDNVWNELKFINFGAVGTKLNNWAKELKEQYDSRHQVETVGEIKQFVDSLGELQNRQRLLKLHTGISSKIMEMVNEQDNFQNLLDIEQNFCMNNFDNKVSYEKILDLMYSNAPQDVVLRLCCLLSITKNGIRDKDYLTLKTEISDTFGVQALIQLERLRSYGYFLNKTVFTELTPIKDFHTLSSWYDMYPQLDKTIDPLNPKEPTFSLCGIIPLSVRLIESMYDRSVSLKHYSSQQPFVISRTPSLAKLEQLFESQFGKQTISELVWDQSAESKTRIIGSPDREVDLVLLVYLGGVTLSEVATIKFIQETLRSKNINKRFVIITDGLISSKTIPQL